MAEIGPSFPLWLNAAAAVSRRPRTHYKTHLGTAGLSEGGRTSQFEIKKCWEELLFYLNKKWCSFLLSNGTVEDEVKAPCESEPEGRSLCILTFPTEIFGSLGLEIYLLLFNVSSGTASSGVPAPSLHFQLHSMRRATSLLYTSRERLNLVRLTDGLEHILSALPGFVGIMDTCIQIMNGQFVY